MKAYYLYQSAELGLCYGEVSGSEHGLDTVATLAEHRDGEAAEAGRGQGEGGEEEAGQLEAGPGQQQQATSHLPDIQTHCKVLQASQTYNILNYTVTFQF